MPITISVTENTVPAIVGVSDFRANISTHLDTVEKHPITLYRHNRVYVLMTKEHYIDLINKIKLPHLAQMPQGVHTIVHFTTIPAVSS